MNTSLPGQNISQEQHNCRKSHGKAEYVGICPQRATDTQTSSKEVARKPA